MGLRMAAFPTTLALWGTHGLENVGPARKRVGRAARCGAEARGASFVVRRGSAWGERRGAARKRVGRAAWCGAEARGASGVVRRGSAWGELRGAARKRVGRASRCGAE